MAKKRVEHAADKGASLTLDEIAAWMQDSIRQIVIDPRILGGVTTEQHLRSAEAGMRLLALIAPGWRVGP